MRESARAKRSEAAALPPTRSEQAATRTGRAAVESDEDPCRGVHLDIIRRLRGTVPPLRGLGALPPLRLTV